jgi:hypothetical protein
VTLRWRREADVTEPYRETPAVPDAPTPCRLHPEQVVDHPYHQQLPADLQRRLREWDGCGERHLPSRYLNVAIAPGWKVGGHAPWNVTDLLPTPCPACGTPAPLLLVAASSEYSGDDREHWQPSDDPDPDPEPTGISVGRAGSLRIFACLTCPGTPFTVDVQ